MDTIELWIWEHATKHGMTEVLTKIKSSFSHTSIPNSWLSALYLQEIRNEWNKPDTKITPKELNALRKCLTSIFKHYIKDLKLKIRTTECIQLELYCKASFLVMRSTSCTATVKLQAKEAVFPCWNMAVWTKIKNYFGLKNDLSMEETKKNYSELRSKLGQTDHEKEILNTFGEMMKKYFPSLISFLRKIKLSRLEKIQKNKMKVDNQYESLRDRLSNSLLNELILLDLLDDVRRKKMTEKALKTWNESKQVEATEETSIEATLYALPPDPKIESNDNQFYPSCFQTNPFMPTHIVLDNDGQLETIPINRNVPRKPDGETFEPHWFVDTRLPVIKSEINMSVDCERQKITVPERFDGTYSIEKNLERSLKSSSYITGLEKEEISVPSTPEEENLKRTVIRGDIRGLASYNLPCGSERINSVQSWIDNSYPHSPSSVEDDNNVSPRYKPVLATLNPALEAEIQHTALNRKTAEPTETEEELTELESHVNTSLIEVQKSSDACFHPSDSDFVSSTTASSCNRIQTRDRYTYLTRLANQKKKATNDSRSREYDSDVEFKITRYGFSRRLRSQSCGVTPGSVLEQRNAQYKRKCRKLSSSTSTSGCLTTPKMFQIESQTSDGLQTSYKTADSMDAETEESWNGEKRTRQVGKWEETPPVEETHSNHHSLTQQGNSIASETELVTNGLGTGFKRKLCDDTEMVPNRKRISVDNISNGRTLLPKALETLKLQSTNLRITDPCFVRHCEKLDLCVQRVSLRHQELLMRNTLDHSI